jgi:hypothetical protein
MQLYVSMDIVAFYFIDPAYTLTGSSINWQRPSRTTPTGGEHQSMSNLSPSVVY